MTCMHNEVWGFVEIYPKALLGWPIKGLSLFVDLLLLDLFLTKVKERDGFATKPSCCRI